MDLPFSRLLQAFLQNRLLESAHIVAGPIRERGMILQRNEYRHGSRLRVFHEVKGAPLLLPAQVEPLLDRLRAALQSPPGAACFFLYKVVQLKACQRLPHQRPLQ